MQHRHTQRDRHTQRARWWLLAALLIPGALMAQTGRGSTDTGTVVVRDSVVSKDTTRVFVLKDQESVQIQLAAGVSYAAVIDSREVTLEIKPIAGNLRDVLIDDVSMPGSMEPVSRFNVRAADAGLYELRIVAQLPGRDLTLRLTGPIPPPPPPPKTGGP